MLLGNNALVKPNFNAASKYFAGMLTEDELSYEEIRVSFMQLKKRQGKACARRAPMKKTVKMACKWACKCRSEGTNTAGMGEGYPYRAGRAAPARQAGLCCVCALIWRTLGHGAALRHQVAGERAFVVQSEFCINVH